MDSICKFLTDLSIETWERIEFARTKPGLKIYETTITQNIIYSIRRSVFADREIRIVESKNEKANGADIFLGIRKPDGRLWSFALQAKIIYHNKLVGFHNGRYDQLDHIVKGTKKRQVDLLIDYAKTVKTNLNPGYLLYNYVSGAPSRSYGLTICDAYEIRKTFLNKGNSKPTFDEIHPAYGTPLSRFICDAQNAYYQFQIKGYKTQPARFLTQVFVQEGVTYDDVDEMFGDMKEEQHGTQILGFKPKFGIIIDPRDR